MDAVPKPKDAATLILVRQDSDGPRILMGKRAGGHSFMPDKYVFPGGKVDRCDRFIPAASELSEQDHHDLTRYNTPRHPRAFGLAAIRETFEETGLIVGNEGRFADKTGDPGWASYSATGAIPCLKHLRFFARAITPPMRHKRFDARFFMADAGKVLLDGRAAQDGAEMADLRWFSYDDALSLDLPTVTRFMLGELAARLREPNLPHRPAFLRWNRKRHQLIRI